MAMTDANIAPIDLASRLAARLCHDFVNPAGSVVNGLDILAASPTGEMRRAAMEMIDGGARRLLTLIEFSRVAFGDGDEEFAAGALEALARRCFSDLRPTLDWTVEVSTLAGPAARILLNLAWVAGESLAFGGIARAWGISRGGKIHLGVDAVGPRAKLHPEVLNGLKGEGRGEGLSGRWAPAYFVHALVTRAGGEAAAEINSAGIAFSAILP